VLIYLIASRAVGPVCKTLCSAPQPGAANFLGAAADHGARAATFD
jgi:hypothetical protein